MSRWLLAALVATPRRGCDQVRHRRGHCQAVPALGAVVSDRNGDALAELFGAVAFLCPPGTAADLICPEARREMVVLEQKAVACIFRSGKPDGMVRRYGWAG